ncbi:Na/Pi cotransporter family protein [Nitratireductor basaltis]|uniref:Na+/Pi-cotransporter n=1 Tax=Nitratireductor basaltis TaxID=472175 RepID=A0A084U8P9_9HYPH|nr:Na/Pi cotransporter family protein [Nitratireductor basaltis]KFB09335.1 Na+/Pi-cotransporter [Nitratireductor basaltis]
MALFLLHLAGAAALLLWSVRLIRTGVERAYLTPLRRWLRHSGSNSFVAAGTGSLAALLLQSSSAVALLVAGFVSSRMVHSATALAIILGADLGSALMAQLLMFRVTWLSPLLILAGTIFFMRAKRQRMRQTGRILIGLGLVFVSLHLIREATSPLQDNQLVIAVVDYLKSDLLSAFLIGAIAAWLMHSSLAAVLLFATLGSEGLLPVVAAVAMAFGANLGGSFVPWVLTQSMSAAARQPVIANLLVRGGGALAALAGLMFLAAAYDGDLLEDARWVIVLHIGFNFAVLLLGLVLRRPLLRLSKLLLPGMAAATVSRVSALNKDALSEPRRALGCAAREILQMGETIQSMLTSALQLYRAWDDDLVGQVAVQEKDVDRMHFETKLYLARLQEGALNEENAGRMMVLANIATNLEAAGDLISSDLTALARKLHTANLTFSEPGWADLSDFHDRVLANIQVALDLLMTGDVDAARQLLEEKDAIRQLEQALQRRHLERLRMGKPESIETSNLHQETIRALKQINTAFTMIAYPIVEDAGDLLSSRLAQPSRN